MDAYQMWKQIHPTNKKMDAYDKFSQVMIIYATGVAVVCALGILAGLIGITAGMTRTVLQPYDYTSTPLYECAPTCRR